MTSDGPRAPPAKAKEILALFVRDPEMADDTEGIVRWRIPQDRIAQSVDEVSAAVAWLVEQRFLVRESPPGALPVFRLNLERREDAERFVAGVELLSLPRPSGIIVGALLGPVLDWLDAVLRDHVAGSPGAISENPGLTRSRASVEALLTRGAPVLERPAGDTVGSADRARQALTAALDEADDGEPLAALLRRLHLTHLELRLFLLCLAPELEVRYQTIYGVLNDDMGRRTATLGLACRLLGDPLTVRSELALSTGLTRWWLLDCGGALPNAEEPLRVDRTIVAWLFGDRRALTADPRLGPVLRARPWAGVAWLGDDGDVAEVRALERDLTAGAGERAWVALAGDDGDGWRALLESAALQADVPLLRVSLRSLAMVATADAEEVVSRLARAAQLLGAAPVVDVDTPSGDAEGAGALARLVVALEALDRPGVVLAPELEVFSEALGGLRARAARRDPPGAPSLARAYLAAAEGAGLSLTSADAEQLAMTFPLSLGAMASAVRLAVLRGTLAEPAARHAAALAAACRRVASPDLPQFARRVEPAFSLEDVVLPPDHHAQLQEIVAHVRYASKVLNAWGFGAQLPYGRGVAALFCGPSGTGKTMAAQAIARALHTEAYVLDLARVVSKYIGESEKHIDAAFRDAQRAGAVLQIDEADAMFGKRSEVKDAHDRYANIEVAYLLQRMEAFDGVAILTTNLRQNLDPAFLRRLRFVVEFPRPDAEAREAIWRKCLSGGAPIAPDVNLRFLARRLEITGGNIRQIAVRAAFAAARDESAAIEMRHVLDATRAELLKLGMPATERGLTASAPPAAVSRLA